MSLETFISLALSLATVRVCHNATPVLDRPPVASPFHHFSMLNLKPSPYDMCRQGQVQSHGRRENHIWKNRLKMIVYWCAISSTKKWTKIEELAVGGHNTFWLMTPTLISTKRWHVALSLDMPWLISFPLSTVRQIKLVDLQPHHKHLGPFATVRVHSTNFDFIHSLKRWTQNVQSIMIYSIKGNKAQHVTISCTNTNIMSEQNTSNHMCKHYVETQHFSMFQRKPHQKIHQQIP